MRDASRSCLRLSLCLSHSLFHCTPAIQHSVTRVSFLHLNKNDGWVGWFFEEELGVVARAGLRDGAVIERAGRRPEDRDIEEDFRPEVGSSPQANLSTSCSSVEHLIASSANTAPPSVRSKQIRRSRRLAVRALRCCGVSDAADRPDARTLRDRLRPVEVVPAS